MVVMDPAVRAIPKPAGWGRALFTAFLLLTAFAWAVLAGVVPPGWVRLALAGGSLLLLVIAAIVSIPPLLRRSLQRWFDRTIEFQFTAAGLPFILGLVVLLLAAFSSGNNLIYLVAACLLAALLTSGFASALNLSGMALRFHFPARIFAGQETPVQLVLENEKSFLPAYSLTVVARSERLASPASNPVNTQGKESAQSKNQRTGRSSRLPRFRKASPSPAATEQDSLPRMKPAYFPYIARRGRVQTTSTLRFPQRGYYSSASFALSTRFPFALIDKRRRFRSPSQEESILVYPALADSEAVRRHFPALNAELERYEPGHGQDLYRIRPHEAGDGMRRIHWKATARAGQLQVREFTRDASQRLRILFCLEDPALAPAQAEQVISLCAALVWRLASTDTSIEFEGRNAFTLPPAPLRLNRTPLATGEAFFLSCAPAAEQMDLILEYLTLVDARAPLLSAAPGRNPDLQEVAFRASRTPRQDQDGLVTVFANRLPGT